MARPPAPVPDKRTACEQGYKEYVDTATGHADLSDHLLFATKTHNPNDCYDCHELSLLAGTGHDPKLCKYCIADAQYYESLDGDWHRQHEQEDLPELLTRVPDEELMDALGYRRPFDDVDNWASIDDPFAPPRPDGIQRFAENLDD